MYNQRYKDTKRIAKLGKKLQEKDRLKHLPEYMDIELTHHGWEGYSDEEVAFIRRFLKDFNHFCVCCDEMLND